MKIEEYTSLSGVPMILLLDEEKAYKIAHASEWFGTNINIDEIQITEDNSEWEESKSISPIVEIDNDEVEVK